MWGEEKSVEVNKLQENLASISDAYSTTTAAYNEAVEKLSAASDQKPEKADDKVEVF